MEKTSSQFEFSSSNAMSFKRVDLEAAARYQKEQGSPVSKTDLPKQPLGVRPTRRCLSKFLGVSLAAGLAALVVVLLVLLLPDSSSAKEQQYTSSSTASRGYNDGVLSGGFFESRDMGGSSAWEAPGPAAQRRSECPLLYERHTVEEVQSGTQPYLFGGRQQPNCTNCDHNHLWSHFCQFKSHGPVCPSWDVDRLLKSYVDRSWWQMLTLTPCDVWTYLEGRTLWIMGDSMSLDLYKALQCFMFEFWDLEGGEGPPEGMGHELFSLLSTVNDPRCVVLPGTSRICFVRSDTGDFLVDTVLPAFPEFGSEQDLMVVNFGLHHGRREQYEETLGRFADYVAQNQSMLPTILWHQTAAQHYNGTSQGEPPEGKPVSKCAPLPEIEVRADGTLLAKGDKGEELLKGGWRNEVAEGVLVEAGIPIAHSFNETVPLYKYHRSNGPEGWIDCTHFCFPSGPQAAVFGIYRALVEHNTGMPLDPMSTFDEDEQ